MCVRVTYNVVCVRITYNVVCVRVTYSVVCVRVTYRVVCQGYIKCSVCWTPTPHFCAKLIFYKKTILDTVGTAAAGWQAVWLRPVLTMSDLSELAANVMLSSFKGLKSH